MHKRVDITAASISKNNDKAREVVRPVAGSFGFSQLKPDQEYATVSFVVGTDVFVPLPTGYGKSLCFGLLLPVFDLLRGAENRIALVVSSLLAIMKEPVGISAACVSDKKNCTATRRGVRSGEYQLVFFSPEVLFATLEWRRMLTNDLYCSKICDIYHR